MRIFSRISSCRNAECIYFKYGTANMQPRGFIFIHIAIKKFPLFDNREREISFHSDFNL